MSRADKRACVEWLLDNGGKLTQAEIAEKAGVTPRTVRAIVADRKTKPELSPPNYSRKTSGRSEGGDTATGEDDRTEPDGTDSQEPTPEPPRNGKEKPGDYGKCPNCAGTKWDEDEDGSVDCARCHHPYGEPAGDADEDRLKTQRQKTVKTIEAAMRAFDDLQVMLAKSEHEEAIAGCKRLLKIAKGWK
jgi:hypothetical protein